MNVEAARSQTYRITVRGRLDESWSGWFNEMRLECQSSGEAATTTLTGPVADQPALRGILIKLWDLNLTLVSIEVEPFGNRRQTMTPEIKRKIIAWIRGAFLGVIGFAALLLLAAGKWDWVWGWVYISVLTLAMAAHVLVLVPVNPSLLADRAGGLRQPGAKRWDIWLASIASIAFVAIMIVAGLDERWGWTGTISIGWHITGVVLSVIGWTFFLWAMASNPFFSESVRIQENHQVASRGPYRLVRHPGYFGNVIGCLGQPLLFGSWWAFIPAILTIIAFAIRTALEDETLQKELNGYAEYARQVRFRLIPGIW